MNLFIIDKQTNEVVVNSAWIKLIPEFRDLFQKKGNKIHFQQESRGIKRLTFIYFMLDFSSPIADWEDEKRLQEALKFSQLPKEEAETDIMIKALAVYKRLQQESCRPLKTYRAALKGLDAMDDYLENVDFTQTDKQGKLLYTPNEFTQNMSIINKAYDELNKLRRKIEEELSGAKTIRGKASLGDMEAIGLSKDWDETQNQPDNSVKWVELENIIKDDEPA